NGVTIVHATEATCGSAVLGVLALLLARKAQLRNERTLGRVGGLGMARAGKILGLLSLCIGITAGLALGFYSVLNYFGYVRRGAACGAAIPKRRLCPCVRLKRPVDTPEPHLEGG